MTKFFLKKMQNFFIFFHKGISACHFGGLFEKNKESISQK